MNRSSVFRRNGFTLIELLVVVAIVAVCAALSVPAIREVKAASSRTISLHSLRQLGLAGEGYLADHDRIFWKWITPADGGVQWWWGWESSASLSSGEGNREVDYARGPLGPYASASGGVRTDPAFQQFDARLKPKYRNGNFGYAYNTVLAFDQSPSRQKGNPRRATQAEHPSEVIVFATSAQVNTFQRPATVKHPMIEEFYMINDVETTIHFRHGGQALAAMLDGNIRALDPDPATIDRRMPEAKVGRLAPVGSWKYLWNEPPDS